jgi:sterol desaturase/sphingolipid hydroxylase (fatty acid hydroxylase superfamily)
MTPTQFLANAGLVLALMAALAALEVAVPLFGRPREGSRVRTNLGLTALTLLANWALTSLAALAALRLQLEGRGLLAHAALPGPAVLVLGIVVLDLATWLAHRTLHALPALWRVHRVHHADAFVDVTTTLRQHPLEGLWRFAWLIVPAWVLGLTVSALVAYRGLSVVQALLEHANVRTWPWVDRVVASVWVTPNMHKVHHSCLPAETDSNYGNLLALFDRAFGTFTPTERAARVTYGLGGVRSADGPRARRLAPLGRSE